MHPETCCLREGVSPKARRNIPRAPLWSRSILRPSEDLTVFLPPSLWFISPVQLTVFEVYASLTMSTVLLFSEALCFRKFLNRWWAKLSRLRTVFDLSLRWPLATIPDVLKSGSSMTSKLSTRYRAVLWWSSFIRF